MLKCQKCGFDNQPIANNCAQCGQALGSQPVQSASAPGAAYQQPVQSINNNQQSDSPMITSNQQPVPLSTNKSGSKFNKKVIIAIVALVAIASVSVGAFFLGKTILNKVASNEEAADAKTQLPTKRPQAFAFKDKDKDEVNVFSIDGKKLNDYKIGFVGEFIGGATNIITKDGGEGVIDSNCKQAFKVQKNVNINQLGYFYHIEKENKDWIIDKDGKKIAETKPKSKGLIYYYKVSDNMIFLGFSKKIVLYKYKKGEIWSRKVSDSGSLEKYSNDRHDRFKAFFHRNSDNKKTFVVDVLSGKVFTINGLYSMHYSPSKKESNQKYVLVEGEAGYYSRNKKNKKVVYKNGRKLFAYQTKKMMIKGDAIYSEDADGDDVVVRFFNQSGKVRLKKKLKERKDFLVIHNYDSYAITDLENTKTDFYDQGKKVKTVECATAERPGSYFDDDLYVVNKYPTFALYLVNRSLSDPDFCDKKLGGIYNSKGKKVFSGYSFLKPTYDENGIAIIKKDNEYKMVDKSGKVIASYGSISSKFYSISGSQKVVYYEVMDDDKIKLINKDNEVLAEGDRIYNIGDFVVKIINETDEGRDLIIYDLLLKKEIKKFYFKEDVYVYVDYEDNYFSVSYRDNGKKVKKYYTLTGKEFYSETDDE